MEALAGGALVLTDPMHPLPCGIEDGLHVVVYNNMTELKYYLKYYLEHDNERLTIARKGYQAAMSNHRSWNIMEKMVFGDWSKFYFDC
jgi:spore maturation protein CgeB